MAKFKVGDTVRIVEYFPGEFEQENIPVDTGVIEEIDDWGGECGPSYLVKLDNGDTIDCDGDDSIVRV